MDNTAQVIDITETSAVEAKALAIPEQARLIVVTDNDSMAIADNTKAVIKDMLKEINETFKPLADKAFQAHRAITGKWNEVKKPLEDADKYLTGQVKGYLAEVKRKAEEEAARIREEQRKIEEERRLREAEEAEKEGKHKEAEAIIEEEVFVPYVAPVINTPKVDSRKYRTLPRARVTDKMKLIRYVAQNAALSDLLDVNMSVVNKKAGSLGKEINNIPGLEYYEE